MDSRGQSSAKAIGLIAILVLAVAGFAILLSGGHVSGNTDNFVEVLPYIAFPLLIVAVFLILRGGG